MRRPIAKGRVLDMVAEQYGVTRAPAAVKVAQHVLPDRPLLRLSDDSKIWTEGLPSMRPPTVSDGAIVWVKPPRDASGALVRQIVTGLRGWGVHVKLLPSDQVDDVVTDTRVERAPELAAEQSREIVCQLCRELADQAGVPHETVLAEVEPYLALANL